VHPASLVIAGRCFRHIAHQSGVFDAYRRSIAQLGAFLSAAVIEELAPNDPGERAWRRADCTRDNREGRKFVRCFQEPGAARFGPVYLSH
jgi:hypothetical protein